MNDEHVTRYPLCWPRGWKRTPSGRRCPGRFRQFDARNNVAQRARVDLPRARYRLQEELRLLGATNVVISTNVPPKQLFEEPMDVGVAIYFRLGADRRSLACDRWDRVADNMAALAAHIDALRGIDRWGVGTVEQAFSGYAALPPSAEDWWLVLGVSASASPREVETAFKRRALTAHPDHGGSHEEMARLSEAREVARRALTHHALS